MDEITEARIRAHLQRLVGERHPETAPATLKSAAAYLGDRMRSFGLESHEGPIDEAGRFPFPNIIGRLKSAKASAKGIVVVGAQYDTVAGSPGADDNASGLAVLLEVARTVAARSADEMTGDLIPEFVAFSMEEDGFIGSDYYLQAAETAGRSIWGTVVLECVGYTDKHPGAQRVPPGVPIPLPERGDFIGLVGNAPALAMVRAFESAAKTAAPDLSYVSLLVPGGGEAIPDTRRSDHVPFWDRGYPAMMLTDTANFRNPHYHRESDRLETLDIAFITDVARALAETVVALCGPRPVRG